MKAARMMTNGENLINRQVTMKAITSRNKKQIAKYAKKDESAKAFFTTEAQRTQSKAGVN